MVPRLQSTALIAESDRFWQLTEGDRIISPGNSPKRSG